MNLVSRLVQLCSDTTADSALGNFIELLHRLGQRIFHFKSFSGRAVRPGAERRNKHEAGELAVNRTHSGLPKLET